MDKETNKIIGEAAETFSELMIEFIKRIHGEKSDDKEFKEIINRWTDITLALANKNIKITVNMIDFRLNVGRQSRPITIKEKRSILKLSAEDNKILKAYKIIPPDEENKNRK